MEKEERKTQWDTEWREQKRVKEKKERATDTLREGGGERDTSAVKQDVSVVQADTCILMHTHTHTHTLTHTHTNTHTHTHTHTTKMHTKLIRGPSGFCECVREL